MRRTARRRIRSHRRAISPFATQGVSRKPKLTALSRGSNPPAASTCLYINSGGKRASWPMSASARRRPLTAGGTRLRALEQRSAWRPPISTSSILTHFHGDHIAGFDERRWTNPLEFPTRALRTTAQSRMGRMDGALVKARTPPESDQAESELASPPASTVSASSTLRRRNRARRLRGRPRRSHARSFGLCWLNRAGDRLLHVVDLLHQPFQFTPIPIGTSPSIRIPSMAVETRRRVLQRCADEGLS